MGCLYKLTSPSGRSYIGITAKTLDQRWTKHVEHAFGKRDAGALYGALRKYGVEAFTRCVLSESDNWSELCEMEKVAIKEHNTFAPFGYNLTAGGEGIRGPRSAAVKALISVAQKKRFQDPVQRSILLENARKGRAVRARNRAMFPRPLKSRRLPAHMRLSTEEKGRRTKEGMMRPEIREKVLACAKQRSESPLWRARISASKTGQKTAPSSEAKKKAISEARKREWADPVLREKRLEAFKRARTEK